MLNIRSANINDADDIWCILEPVFRAGETYTLPRDITRDEATSYWFAAGNRVFVAEEDGNVLGTYYLRTNQRGGGSHVCNCGYMTAAHATGRGVARTMCLHSKEQAKKLWLPSDAIQLRRQHERASGEAVAEPQL
jgi:hypothetical protein